MKYDRQYSLTSKIILALCSFIVFMSLLEVGLRVAGSVYLSETIESGERVNVEHEPNTRTILCIGDSFTLGSKVPRNGTYPAQLEALIQSHFPGANFRIINRGVCEYNTWQILRFLPSWLDTYKPEWVILLAGSSNRYNPWGFGFDESDGPIRHFLKKIVADSRVIKMGKITVLNLETKFIASGFRQMGKEGNIKIFGIDGREQGERRYEKAKKYLAEKRGIKKYADDDSLLYAWFRFNTGDVVAARKVAMNVVNNDPLNTEALCAAGYFALENGDVEQAEQLYNRAWETAPESEFVKSQMAYLYSNLGRMNLKPGRFPNAIDYLIKGVFFNPDDEYMYYALAKAFDLQSEYDAKDILHKLNELRSKKPELGSNPKFQNQVAVFQNLDSWDDMVSEWLDSDLDKIYKLCSKHKSSIIVMNYPVDYSIANDALKRFSERNSLPFVNNRVVFSSNIEQYGRKTFLLDDDHCTVKGHWLMAENLYNKLASQGAFSDVTDGENRKTSERKQ